MKLLLSLLVVFAIIAVSMALPEPDPYRGWEGGWGRGWGGGGGGGYGGYGGGWGGRGWEGGWGRR